MALASYLVFRSLSIGVGAKSAVYSLRRAGTAASVCLVQQITQLNFFPLLHHRRGLCGAKLRMRVGRPPALMFVSALITIILQEYAAFQCHIY